MLALRGLHNAGKNPRTRQNASLRSQICPNAARSSWGLCPHTPVNRILPQRAKNNVPFSPPFSSGSSQVLGYFDTCVLLRLVPSTGYFWYLVFCYLRVT